MRDSGWAYSPSPVLGFLFLTDGFVARCKRAMEVTDEKSLGRTIRIAVQPKTKKPL